MQGEAARALRCRPLDHRTSPPILGHTYVTQRLIPGRTSISSTVRI
jgi:hypothetical protein